MKKATIQLKYDEEKLTALEKYMKKKEADLETELQQTLQKLYEKYVPPAVREYIESRETGEGKTGKRSTERRNSGREPVENEGMDPEEEAWKPES